MIFLVYHFMAKQTAAFDMPLAARDEKVPAYRWLYEALRAGVLEGRLRPGARLPSTRDLARQHGLSRGTIVSAFELLISEGYVEGSIGSGTYVSKVLPDDLFRVSRKDAGNGDAGKSPNRHVSDYGRRVKPFPGFSSQPTRAFRSNLPALDLFPTTAWAQLATRRLRRAPVSLLLGCEPMGYMPLREAVADYLKTSRGVNCSPGQIAIVSGVQEALEMSARIFLNVGDSVGLEDPSYIGAAMVFEAVGAKICWLPVDNEGAKLRGAKIQRARLVYVTPGHQYPLGMTMSLTRRLELLEWAKKSGALIFEDDYDSEYRYAGRPVPALQGLDRSGSVLFAGSFNKVVFPSLRLGYLVIPQDLVKYFEAAQSVATRHAPLVEQAILCDFISEGHFGRHLRRMREAYAERLSTLIENARERLGGLLEISGIEAGLQTVGWLGQGIQAEAAARAAAKRNVEVVPISWLSRGRRKREALQLGFAAVGPEEIRRGVRDLGGALESLVKRGGPRES